jgi:hypothetical protein
MLVSCVNSALWSFHSVIVDSTGDVSEVHVASFIGELNTALKFYSRVCVPFGH